MAREQVTTVKERPGFSVYLLLSLFLHGLCLVMLVPKDSHASHAIELLKRASLSRAIEILKSEGLPRRQSRGGHVACAPAAGRVSDLSTEAQARDNHRGQGMVSVLLLQLLHSTSFCLFEYFVLPKALKPY